MKIFILEDEIGKYPRNEIIKVLEGHQVTVATNIYDAAKIYKAGTYHLLLLDHDMHGYYQSPEEEDTGHQFVKWLVNQELGIVQPKPPVILHSQNQEARRAMASLLFSHKFRVMEKPFGQDYINYLRGNIAL